MKTHRMEEYESGITLARLVEIAAEWGVPLAELHIEESYEMGGSGMVWLVHMA